MFSRFRDTVLFVCVRAVCVRVCVRACVCACVRACVRVCVRAGVRACVRVCDWVHGVGQSPVCQILLQIAVMMLVTTSPSLYEFSWHMTIQYCCISFGLAVV